MLAVLALLGAAAAVAAKGPAGPGGAGPVLRAIEGTNRADHLVGTARAESITGYRGADRIDGGGGDDDIDGREGDDVISTPDAPGAARLMGGPGDDAILARGPGADTLHGSGGDDRLIAGFGPDALFGGVGDDVLEGGPGYDTLRGGAGDDRLSDGSYGAGLLDGGAGDDAITSSPRGMDLVVCGAGRDAVSADALDIVAPDCERVVRASPSRGTTTLTQVRSPTGRLLGSTGYPVSPDRARGPYRLLWVHDGLTYLATRFRGSDACFVTVEPSGAGRGECGFGRRGRLFVRRIAGARFRWFALMPAGVRTLAVGGRTIPVRDRIAVFSAGRRPGRIVARGAGPAFAVRVP